MADQRTQNPSFTLVFGLTADPIHKGHEQVIHNSFLYAKQNNLNIEKFVIVPTYHPNLIAGKAQPRTSFNHRYNMCQITANEMINNFNYSLYTSDIEKILFKINNKKSYSYDTLKNIKAPHKIFVLSADHFAGRWPKFRKWHRWQQLIEENGLMIHQRPGHRVNQTFIKQLTAINPFVFVVTDLPSVEISSTKIRNTPSKYLKPTFISEKIINYINSNKLY